MVRKLLAGAVFVAALAFPARAQFLGETSPQTIQQKVFSAATGPIVSPNTNPSFPCTPTPAVPCAIPNNGQNIHAITYTISPATACTALQVRLEGSNDGVSFFGISEDALDNPGSGVQGVVNSGGLVAVGYFPVVRLNLLQFSCAGSTLTAFYQGTSSAPPTASAIYQQSNPYRKLIVQNVVSSSAQNGVEISTPFGNSSGSLWVTCSAACASGGVLTVSSLPTDIVSGGLQTIATLSVATSANWQRLDVPAMTTNKLVVTITPTGATAVVWSIYYVFNAPGFPAGTSVAPPLGAQSANGGALVVAPANWSQTANPAAGTQASASRAAGATGVRHIANCITFSAGSVVAPALTALTVNLRDGASGVGTILRTYELIISAATGQNTPPIEVCGLNLIGSPATAMTLEWSAGLANLTEAVSLSGYDVGP